jgi:hypothetical protein
MPINPQAKQNKKNECMDIEINPNKPQQTPINVPIKNPAFLPILFIKRESGSVDNKVPKLVAAMGKVALDKFCAKSFPTKLANAKQMIVAETKIA